VPHYNPKNASCDQYKVGQIEEKVKGGLRGSPLYPWEGIFRVTDEYQT